jgi:hypothetical protein
LVGRFKQRMFDLEKNTVVEAWGLEQVAAAVGGSPCERREEKASSARFSVRAP